MRTMIFGFLAFVFSSPLLAAEAAGEGKGMALKAGAYFIAVGLAAFGGTRAQSGAASSALEGIARNPSAADKIMTPMILSMALMESLVIFTLISIFLA